MPEHCVALIMPESAAYRAPARAAYLSSGWRAATAGACLAGGLALSAMLSADAAAQAGAAPTKPVGEAPEERRVELSVASDVGGVLSPAGRLTIEPSFRFSHTSAQRFTFRGLEVVDTILVGVIEAEEADRNFLEAALTTRLGITDRLEVTARVAGVYRDDRVSFLIPGVIEPAQSREIDAYGMGDIETSAHFQINRGGQGSPILVANLRGRFPTGSGPFDIERDSAGIETELPTGSGFYSVEPSLTTLFPADPVVFFFNLGYQWNMEHDVNKTVAGNLIQSFDPGDTVRTSFGMGFAITDATSISIGYAHDFIGRSETRVNNQTVRSTDIQVGTLSIGFSHQFAENLRGSATVEIGATAQAADSSVIFRLATGFNLF